MLDPSALKGSIQDIAIKVTEEQSLNRNMSSDLKEKTIFVLGSKSVVSFFHSIRSTNEKTRILFPKILFVIGKNFDNKSIS